MPLASLEATARDGRSSLQSVSMAKKTVHAFAATGAEPAGARPGFRTGRVSGDDMDGDFNPEQKRWLEGFASGIEAVRTVARTTPASLPAEPTGPDADQIKAQDAAIAAGGKLADQEKWKRTEHPFEAYERLKVAAADGAKPKPDDNFRWRYHGLFYVAPAQDSYMCRLRIPNGILTHWQFAAIADLADRHGGGYSHVTTRANLQVREITPEHGPPFVEGLGEIGIVPKGSGSDNIRNVTGSATAGIDPGELLDTRPHTRAWHHHILNTRGDVQPAPQVQRRVRRRRPRADARGHQRHRLPGDRGRRGRASRARPLVSAGPWRHHGPPGFRARHRRGAAARRFDQGVGRHREGVRRARRSHQPQQGADEIRARRLGLREIPRCGRGQARGAAAAAGSRPRQAPACVRSPGLTSGCMPKSSRASTGSASCCRPAG